MGLGFGMSRDRYESSSSPTIIERIVEKLVPMPNPNPKNWEVVRYREMKGYLILEMRYPDCTNFEGKKIMVYENLRMAELKAQKLIDPHFSTNKKFKSPIARFEPTARGWNMAELFVETL
jgi:hypothetical protein